VTKIVHFMAGERTVPNSYFAAWVVSNFLLHERSQTNDVDIVTSVW
jgi:hypothetical protein